MTEDTTLAAGEGLGPLHPAGVRQRRPDSIARRILVGGGWSLLGRGSAAFLGLATSAILTRLVSPSDVGTYFVAASVVLVGSMLGGFGLNQLVVRLVAESLSTGRPGRAWRAVWTTLRLSVLGAGLLAGGYLLVGAPLAGRIFGSPGLAGISLLVAGWIVVLTVQTIVAEAHRGFSDIRSAALFGGPLQAGLLLAFLAGALVVGYPLSLSSVVLAALGSAVVGTLAGGVALRRRSRGTPQGYAGDPGVAPRTLVRVAAPLLATNLLAILLSQADLWVVAAFLPESDVAVYGTAARVAGVVGLPLLVANGMLAPLIADLYTRGERAKLQRALRATASVTSVPSLLAAGIFVVAGGPLLGAVYGEHYAAGWLVLAVLSLGQTTHVVAGSCGLALAMSGRQRELVIVTTATAGVLVPCALVLLTRTYGAEGAAVAAASGLALQNVIWVLVARRTIGVWSVASPAELGTAVRLLLTHLSGRATRGAPAQ